MDLEEEQRVHLPTYGIAYALIFFKNCRDLEDEGDKLRDNRAMDPKRPLGHLVWVAFTGAFLLP